MVFEFLRFEVTFFGFDNVAGELHHVLGDLDVGDVVEKFTGVANFVGEAQQRAHQAFAAG